MIDKFDYAEPGCPFCDGEEFYYPKKDGALGRIPVDRIIYKIDGLFDKNSYEEAGRLLVYWKNEAVELKDKRGELAMESELIGYYRKQNQKEKCIASVERALELVYELEQSEMASGATVLINCATAYKAFGMAEDALPLYEKAEQVYKSVLKEGDYRFGGLYNNMALALADVGRIGDAENAYRSALKIMENVDGGEAEAAITYINLAHLYDGTGNTAKIKCFMDKAYDLLCSEGLKRDGYYAFVLEKCAPSFGYFGDTEVYDELKRESERIYAGN